MAASSSRASARRALVLNSPCARSSLVCVCAHRLQKKLWEGVQPLLRTSGDKVAGFKGREMLTSAGPVTVPTLANASIA